MSTNEHGALERIIEPLITSVCSDGNSDSSRLAREIAQAILSAAPPPPAHPDDLAVDRFAAAMKNKLAKKRGEGRGGWDDPTQCTAEFLSRLLREHVEKGDPLDVGNLAMMLHQRGERIAPPPPAREAGLREALVEAEDALRLVEKPAIEDPMHQAAIEQLGDRIGYGALMSGAQAAWRKRLGAQAGGEFVAGPCYATVLSALAKIRAALSQQQETGWRPIEEAPKDGTHFLAWEPYYGIRVARAHIRSDHDDWLSYVGAFNDGHKGGLRATHWRPLPAPPAEGGRE